MCGIAGFQGDFSEETLALMGQAIAHRGPDDAGQIYLEAAKVGLSHQRLAIIDLSAHGHQPMWDTSQTVCIVFNGEIYNYSALRDDLKQAGFSFRSQSDTEVLLNLYLAEGVDMLTRLNGIFAFALWDSRSQTLLIARDGLGVKPLYYSFSEKGFAFASEIKSLLCVPGISRSTNSTALHAYFSLLWSPAPHTIFQEILQVEPGQAMLIQSGKKQKDWFFYRLPYDGEVLSGSESEAVNEVQRLLKQAVNRQMVSDVPVGAFLSGGIDSSAIVALARQQVEKEHLHCFTIAFEDDQGQWEGCEHDWPYAQQVAQHLDVHLHKVMVQNDFITLFEQMIYHMDAPFMDPAAVNTFLISRLARENGISVLLSGAGGDEVFAGYNRHYALCQENHWSWLPAAIRKPLACLAQSNTDYTKVRRRLAKAFRYADKVGDERLASYFYWQPPLQMYSLYSPAFQEQVEANMLEFLLRDSLSAIPQSRSRLDRLLYLDTRYYLPDLTLSYTDRMSMATGVEVRVPLLDSDLLGFVASLPPHLKQHGNISKYILKKAMAPYLPKNILYRSKTGFGAPIRQWLPQLKPFIHETLTSSSFVSRDIFNAESVERLLRGDVIPGIDSAYALFSMFSFELWCRRFLDATPQSDLSGKILKI